MSESNYPSSDREWRLIEKLFLSMTDERRRARLWSIFFKLLTFSYLFLLLFLIFGNPFNTSMYDAEEHTAVIHISGVLAEGNSENNAEGIITALRRAVENPLVKGVILKINSPGGSPVEAELVFSEIERLRAIYPSVKIYTVVSSLAASAAYYIAAASDAIYLSQASMVGSIGVTSSHFGFVDVMKKLGVERRTLKSGAHKDLLDTFLPRNQIEEQLWQTMMHQVHQLFIRRVTEGRGDRLTQDPNIDLFSGLVWSGLTAIDHGLADELGSVDHVARTVIQAETVIDYTVRENRLDSFLNSSMQSFGQSIARGFFSELNSIFSLNNAQYR